MGMNEIIVTDSQALPELRQGTQIVPKRLAAVDEQEVILHAQGPKGLHLRLDEAAVTRVARVRPEVGHYQDTISRHEELHCIMWLPAATFVETAHLRLDANTH